MRAADRPRSGRWAPSSGPNGASGVPRTGSAATGGNAGAPRCPGPFRTGLDRTIA